MTQLEIETRLQNPEDSTDGAWRLQAGTEEAQRYQSPTEGGQRMGVSLGGQNLVTGWAAAVTAWASAHPVNMLAEALGPPPQVRLLLIPSYISHYRTD